MRFGHHVLRMRRGSLFSFERCAPVLVFCILFSWVLRLSLYLILQSVLYSYWGVLDCSYREDAGVFPESWVWGASFTSTLLSCVCGSGLLPLAVLPGSRLRWIVTHSCLRSAGEFLRSGVSFSQALVRGFWMRIYKIVSTQVTAEGLLAHTWQLLFLPVQSHSYACPTHARVDLGTPPHPCYEVQWLTCRLCTHLVVLT